MLRSGSTAFRRVPRRILLSQLAKATPLGKRYISDKAEETFTKLSDENDPQRDAFFKYSWGSWLKNDKLEKEKRITRFSIEGLNDILNSLHQLSISNEKKSNPFQVVPPIYHDNLTVSLPHNVNTKSIGTVNPNEKIRIVSMASIHEGKHHRIYKVDTNSDKSFILRIPYALEDENALAYRIKSEVATMDFVDLKIGLKVPKVYCFGVNALNPVRQPFILEEYIDGKLLMKEWTPLENDSKEGNSSEDKLNTVIKPLSAFQAKVAEINFNAFGSLYFSTDQKELKESAYEGETNEDLKERWRIGPSVERCLWRKKSAMKFEDQKRYLGPWNITSPLEVVKCTALIEAENARSRLSLIQAQASPEVVDEKLLNKVIVTYERLAKLAPLLVNTETKSIPNMEELLKPKLYLADLDPMNVLIKHETEEPYLLDFEGTCIKPYILQNTPQFVAYDGPKIYNLERDVEGYKDMNEAEKAQYDFMYKRTRNQYLWELALSKTLPNLISCVAPPIKVLRNPYVAAIEKKTDKEYLLVEESMIQLKEVWPIFAQNSLVNAPEYPLDFSDEEIKDHELSLNAYHQELITEPFAATQGWMPQDMFDNLLASGILKKQENGDYSVQKV